MKSNFKQDLVKNVFLHTSVTQDWNNLTCKQLVVLIDALKKAEILDHILQIRDAIVELETNS